MGKRDNVEETELDKRKKRLEETANASDSAIVAVQEVEQEKPEMKMCKGTFSMWPNTDEHFPDGGDYCAEFLAHKARSAAPEEKPVVRKAAPDRVIKR